MFIQFSKKFPNTYSQYESEVYTNNMIRNTIQWFKFKFIVREKGIKKY